MLMLILSFICNCVIPTQVPPPLQEVYLQRILLRADTHFPLRRGEQGHRQSTWLLDKPLLYPPVCSRNKS